jgi:hypothetical protein
MNLLVFKEKKAWGVTSERILARIMDEICPAYNTPGPFGLAALEPIMDQVSKQIQEICEQEQARAHKGFTISSWFRVDFDPALKSIQVVHTKNTNEDEVFLTLIKG